MAPFKIYLFLLMGLPWSLWLLSGVVFALKRVRVPEWNQGNRQKLCAGHKNPSWLKLNNKQFRTLACPCRVTKHYRINSGWNGISSETHKLFEDSIWRNSLVIAWWVGVVEVAIGVHFAESSQTDPAEILLTGGTGHLVTAMYLLQKWEKTERALSVILLIVLWESTINCILLNNTPDLSLQKVFFFN